MENREPNCQFDQEYEIANEDNDFIGIGDSTNMFSLPPDFSQKQASMSMNMMQSGYSNSQGYQYQYSEKNGMLPELNATPKSNMILNKKTGNPAKAPKPIAS